MFAYILYITIPIQIIIIEIVFLLYTMQIGMYEDHKISELISLDDLDVDSEVKQLFIDVLRKDPQSRPGAIELLNRPLISSAVEYGRYFDECYDSEDAEDLEASPAAECDDSLPIADVPQQISLTSSGGHSSLHSLGDKVGELPQIPCGVQLQRNRGSQDSGVGGDLENGIAGSNVYGSQVSQMSMRSSSSGSRGGNQQILSHQDSGLEDSLMCGDCSQTNGEQKKERKKGRARGKRGEGGREREREVIQSLCQIFIFFLPCSVYSSASDGHACTIHQPLQ